MNLVRAVRELRKVTFVEIAHRIIIDERTVRRWANDEQDIPGPAAILLQLWFDGSISGAEIEKASNRVRKRAGR